MGKRRLPFFWDYDLGEEDLRAILAGDDEERKVWVISRLLNAAPWDEIWSYLTVDDIRAHFPRLRFRSSHLRELWAHALEVWSREGGGEMVLKESGAPYEPNPPPRLRPGILTPLQEVFLTRFFAYAVGKRFFLTGGTALTAFYLYHRLSEGLDLFTLEGGVLDAAQDVALTVSNEMGWEAKVERLSPHLLRAVLMDQEGGFLRVDFVRETAPQFGEKRSCEGVMVDSLVDIATNKVTAILGRSEAKDFVDLYVLLREIGYDFDSLLRKAEQKDRGLTPFFLAGAMRQVRRIRDLPVMLRPVDWEALVAFYEALADRLLARHRPPSS